MPSLTALRYAAAAARSGSFTGAARACEVAQPTISNAIAALEEELGAALFERGARGLTPTPAGARLLPLIETVVSAADELERGAAALTEPALPILRLGFSPIVGGRLGVLMQPFTREHRDVDVIYKECAVDDMEARLDANTVDVVFGVGLRRGKARERQLLYRDRLRYLGGTDRERITVEEIARRPLVLSVGLCGLAGATRALFAQRELAIDEYRGQAMSYGVLQDWAELGIGGAILPESLIRGAIDRYPVVLAGGKPALLTYEAVWRKDMMIARHHADAIRYLRTVAPRLAQGMTATATGRS